MKDIKDHEKSPQKPNKIIKFNESLHKNKENSQISIKTIENKEEKHIYQNRIKETEILWKCFICLETFKEVRIMRNHAIMEHKDEFPKLYLRIDEISKQLREEFQINSEKFVKEGLEKQKTIWKRFFRF